MIVDSSAVVAIARREPEASRFIRAISIAGTRRMSAANYLEAAVVIDRSGDPLAIRRFDELVRTSELTFEPVTVEQAKIARAAYRDFGRGSGHPARLNFGDCFAYALASVTREPPLYKGDTLGHTDLTAAIAAG